MRVWVFYVPETSVGVPEFRSPVGNVTVPLGREAVLTCSVDNLRSSYKVRLDSARLGTTRQSRAFTAPLRVLRGVRCSEGGAWLAQAAVFQSAPSCA